MKYKAPDNAGPSVSVGGATFSIVDGIVELPDEGDYSGALEPFGYEALAPEAVQEPAGAQEGDDQGKDAPKDEKAPSDGEAKEDGAADDKDAPKPKVKKA